MRTLVHLSDVHFGRADERVVAELVTSIRGIAPDLVAVSGDLTQRARPIEFQRAREFLNALPEPQIVVPGNHDVPMHNVYERFRNALGSYREYVSQNLEPYYRDEEMAVLGLNTARSLTIKGGRINEQQVTVAEERFCDVRKGVFKVLVTHHPFDLPPSYNRTMLTGRAAQSMARFSRCGVDLLLAGHYHQTHSGHTAERYAVNVFSAVFVQAGTACSTRVRGESNSFNVITLDADRMVLRIFRSEQCEPFTAVSSQSFRRLNHGWTPE